MVKSKSRLVKKTKNPPPSTRNSQRKKGLTKLSTNALDQNARAYAYLLTHPCDAPLVNPIYPGSSSGYVTRFQKFLTLPTVPADLFQVLHLVPGSFSASNVGLLSGGTTSGASVANMATQHLLPGHDFLFVNASSARCIGCCLKFTYGGAESTRGGRVHYGHTQASLIDLNDAVVPDTLAPSLEHFSRTPPETVEIIWKPSEGDMMFRDPASLESPQLRDTMSAITIFQQNNTGAMIYDITCIYEWQPKFSDGVGASQFSKPISKNTFDDVYGTILNTGFKFVRDTMHRAGGDLLSRLANNLGVMPTRTQTNSLSF